MTKNYLLWGLMALMLVSLIFVYFQGNNQTAELEETLTAMNQTRVAGDKTAESNIGSLRRTSVALNQTQVVILSDGSAESQIAELQLTSVMLNEAQTAISETIIALLTETPTPTNTATSTNTFTPSASPTATRTPRPTHTFTATLPAGAHFVTMDRIAYVYLGDLPGEGSRATVGQQTFLIIGRSAYAEYFQIDYQGRLGWIKIEDTAHIEGNLEDIPLITHPITATPTITPSRTLTPTFTLSPTCPAPSTPAFTLSTVTIEGLVTLRKGPGNQYDAIDNITTGIYPLTGLDAEGIYYRIDFEGEPAWVSQAGNLRVDGNLNCLPILPRPTATSTSTPRPTITPTFTLIPGVPSIVINSPIRVETGAFPGEDSRIINLLAGTFPILGVTQDGNYYLINWEGENGWIDLRRNQVLVVGDVAVIPIITLPKPTP